jgi:hypothetical protein
MPKFFEAVFMIFLKKKKKKLKIVAFEKKIEPLKTLSEARNFLPRNTGARPKKVARIRVQNFRSRENAKSGVHKIYTKSQTNFPPYSIDRRLISTSSLILFLYAYIIHCHKSRAELERVVRRQEPLNFK